MTSRWINSMQFGKTPTATASLSTCTSHVQASSSIPPHQKKRLGVHVGFLSPCCVSMPFHSNIGVDDAATY
eukprot:m.136497 g.136497  ORF g.136497 m.136497 type:complete len:71 (+) comp13947_c0_seq1:3318-3530(+)